jgi:hypothetical protein
MSLDSDIVKFGKEVETALRVFYAYKSANELLSQGTNLFYKNPHFWMIFVGSVQRTLFISLGRLYDPGNDAFTFRKFIKGCKDNIKEFGRNYVEKRKIESLRRQGELGRPEWLDGFLNNACYAELEDIDRLATLARPYNRRMKGLYLQIRNKVFAHAILQDEAALDMLADATFTEIENALTALWSIYDQVWKMAYNGKRNLTFEIRPYPYKQQVHEAVKMAVTGNQEMNVRS